MNQNQLAIDILREVVVFALGVLSTSIFAYRSKIAREKEHKEQMQLLRDQLEEQKKQREFSERVYEEKKKPKPGLQHLNVNSPKSSSKRWQDKD